MLRYKSIGGNVMANEPTKELGPRQFTIKTNYVQESVSALLMGRSHPVPKEKWRALAELAGVDISAELQAGGGIGFLGHEFQESREHYTVISALAQLRDVPLQLSNFRHLDLFGDANHQSENLKETLMKDFTVIASVADEGTLVVRHVLATDSFHAFGVVANEEKDKGDSGLRLEFLVALDGRQMEGETFALPGEGIVSAETVIEQDDVFGPSDQSHAHTQKG
jgi:hypothetical protein